MSDDIIRSYHNVWERDLKIPNFGSFRPRKPVRARALGYAAALGVVYYLFAKVFLSFSIFTLMGMGIPIAIGFVLAEATVRGRRVHDEIRVRVMLWRMSKHLAGGWWPIGPDGEIVRFKQAKRY